MFAGREDSGEAVPMLSVHCLPMLKVPKSHSPAHYFDNVSKEDSGCSILNGKAIKCKNKYLNQPAFIQPNQHLFILAYSYLYSSNIMVNVLKL